MAAASPGSLPRRLVEYEDNTILIESTISFRLAFYCSFVYAQCYMGGVNAIHPAACPVTIRHGCLDL